MVLGSLAFLFQGFLIFISAIPAFYFSLIPLGANVSYYTTPLTLLQFSITLGTSAVLVILAYVVISSARAVYSQNFSLAKKRTSMAIVAAFVGAAVFNLASAYLSLFSGGITNIFLQLSVSYFYGGSLVSNLAFVLVIAGSLIARWQINQLRTAPENTH